MENGKIGYTIRKRVVNFDFPYYKTLYIDVLYILE